MDGTTFDIAVIGGGGAGTMSYLRAVLNGDRSAFLLGDAERRRKGRATWVRDVDNIPGLHGLERPVTSTTRSTLKWLERQPRLRDFGEVKKVSVDRLEKEADGFLLHFREKKTAKSLRARHVILATGVMDVQPMIGGSIEPIFPFANRGDVLYCVRCDGHRTIGKRLSLIGCRDVTIGIAAMMRERYGHEGIRILTNGLEEAFGADALDLAEKYGMTIHRKPIIRILGSPSEGLEGYELDGGERIRTEVTIVSLGLIVNNQLLTALGGEVDEVGKARVSEKYESSIEDLFVVGDLVSGRKMQIYTGWDEAVDAADECNRRLRMQRRKALL